MADLTVLFSAPELNLQLVVDGILTGAVFALAAYGMALVWGVMNVINVAQGELVMLGGYVVIVLSDGVAPLLAVPVAPAVMFVVGWALYRIVIFRIIERDLFISLLATFGLSIALQQLANEAFGANVRTVDAGLGSSVLGGGLVVSHIKLIAFAVALVLGGALQLFLKLSRLGQAIRATAQNARAARVLGIDADRVYAATFALNAAICGAAGALVAMTWIIHPYLGLIYTVRAFMIVVIAGLGSMFPVLIAGSGLGVVENYDYFAIGTLGLGIAFADAAAAAAAGWDFIGAGSGMVVPLFPGAIGIRQLFFYYAMLALALVTLLPLRWLYDRPLRLALNAIRDDEDKAESLGLHTTRYKILAWCVCAFFLGMAGALTGNVVGFIDPRELAFASATYGVWMVVMAILGGKGTLWGPVIGAGVFHLTQELFWTYLLRWQRVALGVLIVLIVVLFPTGIMGWLRQRRVRANAVGAPPGGHGDG